MTKTGREAVEAYNSEYTESLSESSSQLTELETKVARWAEYRRMDWTAAAERLEEELGEKGIDVELIAEEVDDL